MLQTKSTYSNQTKIIFFHLRTVLSFKYAAILNDPAMLRVNFFGLVLNIIYMIVYYQYTPDKNKTTVWAQIGLSGLLSAVVLGYAQYEHPDLIEFRFGLIMTVFLFALVSSPFLSLVSIWFESSTSFTHSHTFHSILITFINIDLYIKLTKRVYRVKWFVTRAQKVFRFRWSCQVGSL